MEQNLRTNLSPRITVHMNQSASGTAKKNKKNPASASFLQAEMKLILSVINPRQLGGSNEDLCCKYVEVFCVNTDGVNDTSSSPFLFSSIEM